MLALSAATTPALAQRQPAVQRGGPPGQETPYILVPPFHAPTRQLAVAAADELRSRLQSEHSAKDLFVITKTSIESTLRLSGYPVDSALNVTDLMELARSLHAEYVVDGTATPGASGKATRLDTRVLIRTGEQILSQPLPAADGKDVGDAAKLTERSITESLKQMPSYKECLTGLRAGKNDDAAAKARLGVAAYPNAAFSRICLLNAYSSSKTAPPDSIIALASHILAIDSTSLLALANLADAYGAKGDKDKEIDAYQRMHALDPGNQTVTRALIDRLGPSEPQKALTIIDAMLKENPGDTALLRTRWLLLLRLGQFKNAIAAGEDLVKADTAAATLDYFQRQIGAAQSDSDNAKMQELASRATQKFPKEVGFPSILAQTYRKSGQLQQAMQAARRATEADPKDTRAWLLAIVTASDMNQADTALALARNAAAAGADKQQLEAALLSSLVAPVVKKAQESKERADWEAALVTTQALDAAFPSPASKFYFGLASFQVGYDAIQNASRLGEAKGRDAKASRAKACAEAKVAEEKWADATIAMTSGGGGAYNKDGATSIMNGIQQYGDYIPKMKAVYCTR